MTEPTSPESLSGTRGGSGRDPRTRRTVGRLRDALREALARGPLEDVTVSSLCRDAKVHRTTFYSHYADVGDVVAHVFTAEIDDVLDLPDTSGMTTDEVAASFQSTLIAAFGVIAADRSVFRAALGGPTSSQFRSGLTAMFRSRLLIALDIWHRHGAATEVNTAVATTVVAGGLTAAVVDWARADDLDTHRYADAVRDQMPPWWPRGSDDAGKRQPTRGTAQSGPRS